MNIFDGANFGDKFKTRGGDCALFIFHWYSASVCQLYVENYGVTEFSYSGEHSYGCDEMDVVGKWKEQVDDEELTNLAIKCRDERVKLVSKYTDDPMKHIDFIHGFRAGYRKAKKNS